MQETEMTGTRSGASRRVVVGGLLGAGIGVPFLAACGSSKASDGSGSSSGSASGSIKTSDVPVGGGTIFEDEKVVVTQPSQGDFKAFSATCTHQGCLVSKISGSDIECTCHGSKFSIKDGSVVNGPATKPLEALTATVQGDDISVS